MNKLVIIGAMAILILGGWYFFSQKSPQSTIPAVTTNPTESGANNTDIPEISVVGEKLDVPWALAFLPDGRMLVTERTGNVIIVDGGVTIRSSPAGVIKADTKLQGEGGLLGITLHPDFSQNHYVYLYYTYLGQGSGTLNRVVRMKLIEDKLVDEEIIVDKIPGALFHNGGRIKFGPDGYLYITTGDAQNSSQAQDTDSLAGKILRVTPEGKVPADNPFANIVYSYGHRNPQGIAWDNNGQLWATEHGRSNPTGFDEVNLIQSGRNYGWETIQGDETKSGMETPKINSGATTTWAPSGAVFVGNSFFFAGLKGETLYEAVIENDKVVQLKEHLVKQFGRLREVVVGPDGMLYVTTSNKDGRGNANSGDDKIIRVNPAKLK